MSVLAGKRITIAVTGGIAAYKVCTLVRDLRKAGAEVQVAMTAAAQRFVTPMMFEVLSGHPVATDVFAPGIPHIALTHAGCDLFLVVPATANILAKAANGIADDVVTSAICASTAPVVYAPAMNTQMWLHAATQRNVRTLLADGAHVLPTGCGSLACGEVGSGRMLEPEEILAWCERILTPQELAHKKIVVTAGPTFEPIDPVRGITNRSSGRQGYAIAQAAWEAGAEVTLISGPVALAAPTGVNRVSVETAQEMLAEVKKAVAGADVFVSTAAVSDWGINNPAEQKLKKASGAPQVLFTENPDILAYVPREFPRVFCVGFAAETQDILANARKKLKEKGVKMIVANDANTALGGTDNTVWFVDAEGDQALPRMPKTEVASHLVRKIAKSLRS